MKSIWNNFIFDLLSFCCHIGYPNWALNLLSKLMIGDKQ